MILQRYRRNQMRYGTVRCRDVRYLLEKKRYEHHGEEQGVSIGEMGDRSSESSSRNVSQLLHSKRTDCTIYGITESKKISHIHRNASKDIER